MHRLAAMGDLPDSYRDYLRQSANAFPLPAIFMQIEQKYFTVEEVYMHCNFSLCAFHNALDILKDEFRYQYKGLWAELQVGLTNAAIVSSYLFSSKPTANMRANFLRETLKPSEASPLKNKAARNYLTHIDEKFDYWLNHRKNFTSMVEAVFPNRESFKNIYSRTTFFRRVLLREELVFIFQMSEEISEFNLQPLINELNLILNNAEEYLHKLEKEDNKLYFVSPFNK